MPIPDYEALMLPVLQFASDGQEHTSKELVAALTNEFNLTPEEQAERLPSGQQTVIANRAGWATTYLKKAELMASVRRGVFKITPEGLKVLAKCPPSIDKDYLKSNSEAFRDYFARYEARTRTDMEDGAEIQSPDIRQTPEVLLDQSFHTLRAELASTILQKVQAGSPESFERVVVELLVAMGYGGSRKDAGTAVGRSGDGGIDGIIKEDRLGLDTIYIQAKRWEKPIGRPEIQKFVGALQGVRAKKGVFITTSRYSTEAIEYSANVDTKLVLIDGPTLAQYMIDFGLGVSTVETYEIKRLDSDYFDEEVD